MTLDKVKTTINGNLYIEYSNNGHFIKVFGQMGKCKQCGNNFFASNRSIKKVGQRFCTRICANKWISLRNPPNFKNGKSHTNEYKRKYLKTWRHENPFKTQLHNLKRRILTSNLTVKTIQMVYEDNIKKYGTLTCYLCLKPIEFKKDCLEHKTPISRGGNNDFKNLGIAHRSCNIRKKSKTETEFRILNDKFI